MRSSGHKAYSGLDQQYVSPAKAKHTAGFTPSLKLRTALRAYLQKVRLLVQRRQLQIRPHSHSHTVRSSSAGFTLVELLVSVSIFATVMLIAVGTLIVMINAANTSQVAQAITTDLSFAIDSVSRTLRTGHDYYCTGSVSGSLPSGTQSCEDGDDVVVFTNGETGNRMAYRFDSGNGSIVQRVGGGAWVPLLSDSITVEDAAFFVENASPSDGLQPIIRILLYGKSSDTSLEVQPEYYIQTTVTSRLLDV